jgi:S1-C subfamily serine protease
MRQRSRERYAPPVIGVRAGTRFRKLSSLGLALGLLAGLGCPQGDVARPPPIERPIPGGLLADEQNTIEVFRRTSSSVVFVTNTEVQRSFFQLNATERQRGSGSGFLWDDAGHVVTNYHVIQGGNRFSVTLADGSAHEAKVVGFEPRKDLAVLAIDPSGISATPLTLGDSNALVVGQKVLAIGNPFGLDGSLSTGVISALGREIQSVAGTVIEDVIQTDASINPGNSGGPLLDSKGRLIGVTTAIFSTSGSSAGVGFAVPVATVQRLVPQLIEFGHVKWAGLGITVLPDHMTARWGVEGVVVRQVFDGSPAERAGMRSISMDRSGIVRSFDLITEVDRRVVLKTVDLIDALDDHDSGDVVPVRFVRDGQPYEANVELTTLD